MPTQKDDLDDRPFSYLWRPVIWLEAMKAVSERCLLHYSISAIAHKTARKAAAVYEG